MTRRAIDVRDLDDDTRTRLGLDRQAIAEQLQQRRDGRREGRREGKPRVARNEQAIAEKRVHTGRAFEGDLAITHQQYVFQKWGKLWPHSPPFVRIKGEWRPKAGGGPVDYTGHVTVTRIGWGEGRTKTGKLHGAKLGADGARTVPVAFDAKVGDATSAIYHHEQKRQHQLHTLREASATGVAAFLLVLMPQLDRPHGRVFAIDVAAHFTELLSDGIRLFEPARRATLSSARVEAFPLLPSIGLRETPAIVGWDWIPLLDWITNGGD